MSNNRKHLGQMIWLESFGLDRNMLTKVGTMKYAPIRMADSTYQIHNIKIAWESERTRNNVALMRESQAFIE